MQLFLSMVQGTGSRRMGMRGGKLWIHVSYRMSCSHMLYRFYEVCGWVWVCECGCGWVGVGVGVGGCGWVQQEMASQRCHSKPSL